MCVWGGVFFQNSYLSTLMLYSSCFILQLYFTSETWNPQGVGTRWVKYNIIPYLESVLSLAYALLLNLVQPVIYHLFTFSKASNTPESIQL